MSQIGEYVQITCQSQPELNSLLWEVKGLAENGRIIVESVEETHRRISVRQEAIRNLALVPAGMTVHPDIEAMMLEQHIFGGGNGLRLNARIDLPGLGGNYVYVRETIRPQAQSLVMYPRLDGYDMFFFSTWSNETIELLDCDVLKLCPQGQVWPWCAHCRRFLLPVEAHRESSAHSQCRRNLEFYGRARTRVECLARIAYLM